jgi:hypothetical protein
MSETEKLFVECSVLVESLARKVKNQAISNELDIISKRITELSAKNGIDIANESKQLGLYNDHKLDYGVQPRSNIAWTLQTR